MIQPQNKSADPPSISQLQRIRILDNRMRKPRKSTIQEQSLKTIKGSYERVGQIKAARKQCSRLKNDDRQQNDSEQVVKMQVNVSSYKKITDFFILKGSAKKQENFVHDKQRAKTEKTLQFTSYSDIPDQNRNPNPTEDPYLEEIKMLKEKIKQKDDQFMGFKSTIKREMLDQVIKNHYMKRNEMRLRVSNNKIRLGNYLTQKKTGDSWADGIQIRDIRQKLQVISKQKQELERAKRLYSKKSNKQSGEDLQESKNAITSQLYFLSRQQFHLNQMLRHLEEEKMLHIKQLRLLHEEDCSKYGKVDVQTGTCNWPKIGQYQLLGLLGKGGFSQVYKAFDTQQLREVACKIHELNPQWNQAVKQKFMKYALLEEEVHTMLNHPNIVKLYKTIQIDSNAFSTILEYCEGPDLSYYLKKHKKLPQKEAKIIIKQVANAIKYLHELPEKVIHYDLKPQNIIFHKGRIKITDFGLSKKTSQQIIELTSQGVGTYWYLPPECFMENPLISAKVDIWSIGVIYFEMLYGEKPFGNQMSQMRVLNEGIILKATTVNFPSGSKYPVSAESKQFIKSCLKANVEERLDIRGVCSHSLFDKR